MKILIAEDDLTSRRILEAALTKWGYDVISVTNGNDAIERLQEADAPKLALLDWIMPDKDGVEVCRIVRQMKTKWGSCSIEKKRIWLNLELAKKPGHCLEYILVHEMIHLLERHHNDKFKSYMESFLPNWKQFKEELNRIPVSHADWSY